MTEVVRGPGSSKFDFRNDDELTAAFRIIRFYDLGTASIVTRLDVAYGRQEPQEYGAINATGEQYNSCFMSCSSQMLMLPQGVVEGISIKANPEDLICSLRGLANELERELSGNSAGVEQMERIMGKEAKMNNAAGHEPKAGHTAPASDSGKFASKVGNETKANVRGAQMGGSMAEAAGNPLKKATAELHRQHPIKHNDHGPHHGGLVAK